jgi:signal peptidase I
MPKLIRTAIFLTDKMEKLLRKNGSKVPEEMRQRAQQTIAEVRESIRRGDVEEVRRGLEELRPVQKRYFPGAHKPVWRAIAEFLGLALVVSLFLRTFVVAAFTIPTSSMEPTLAPGDMILVWRSAYGVTLPFTNHQLFKIRSPRRWEIAVFTTSGLPVGDRDQGKAFIKRIIGLPGEEIEIRDGEIYVNGRPALKPGTVRALHYLRKGLPAFHNAKKIRIPSGMYLVLGDNTNDSEDSRFWGFLPEENMRGRAFLVFFPRSRIHSI